MQVINTDISFPLTTSEMAYMVKLYVAPLGKWTCVVWPTFDDAMGTVGGLSALLGVYALLVVSFYSDFLLDRDLAKTSFRFKKQERTHGNDNKDGYDKQQAKLLRTVSNYE